MKPRITKKLIDEVLLRGTELVSKKNGWVQLEFSNKAEVKKSNCFCALGAVARASVDVAESVGVKFDRNVLTDDITDGACGGYYTDDGDPIPSTPEQKAAAEAVEFAHELYEAASDKLSSQLNDSGTWLTSVPTWNDSPDRTQDEVVALFLDTLTTKK